MTPAPADKNHLQISCPSCSQRFKVGLELMGKTVECGSCESRFEVTEDLIVKGAKFYPGERDGAALGRFQRVPGEVIPAAGAKPAGILPQQEKGYFSPISKVTKTQTVIGWLGVILILALVYLLGFNPGGPLDSLPTFGKLLVAIVGGLAGLGMIAYANPRNRIKTLRIAALFAVILLSMPFLFKPTVLSPVSTEVREVGPEHPVVSVKEQDESPEGLRKLIGTERLDDEIAKLTASGSSLHAYGVWLRDLSDSNKLPLRDYMLRATEADPGSHIYPREGRDYLMVVTGVKLSIDELAAVVARFGRNQKIHRELGVIEVQVDGTVFVQGPLEKLTDKNNPAFYDLNKRELESIQLERVSGAVKRLADAEPKIYRDDITRQLIVLLGVEQVDFPADVCRALVVWAEDPTQAGNAAFARMETMRKAKTPIPREMVALLAKAKNKNALPIVEELWLDDATAWETLLGDFGPIAEPGILARFRELEGTNRHSAARILARIGGRASLPVLDAAKAGAEVEMQILISDAEKAIRARL